VAAQSGSPGGHTAPLALTPAAASPHLCPPPLCTNVSRLADKTPVADKIVDKQELLAQVASARAAGQTIVHCHGCFDIVHPGHVRYLEFARRQGDLLVVSLTGDDQISKGEQRPYIPQELRAENLAALEVVDLVYIDPAPTAASLLAELRPDVYVKGREYATGHHPDFAEERRIVEHYGGRVVFSSGEVVFSSTALIETLARDADLDRQRLTAVCRRHGIDRHACHDLLERFTGKSVLVVGDLILDRYVFCDATELASEAPMISMDRLEERRYVGAAGVVARHLAALGAKAFLVSTAADDEATDYVHQVFENENIQSHLIRCRTRLPEKTRFVVDTSKLLRVADGRPQPLDSIAERRAAEWIRHIAGQLDAVIFCDFGYGTITPGLLDLLRPVLRDHRCITTADVSGSRSRLLDFKNVDLLCPTERELRSALHDFDGGLSTVAFQAMDATQARHMIVTLGKKGLVVFDRPTQDTASPQWRSRLKSEYLPSLADPVVDPLGCGDAVLATATLTLAAGGSLMQAAYLGSAAAAVEIRQLGNVPLDRGTLQQWLAARSEISPELPPADPSTAGAEAWEIATRTHTVGRHHARVPVIQPGRRRPPSATRTDETPLQVRTHEGNSGITP